MCKIITAIAIKNRKVIKKLLDFNSNAMIQESDGFGFVSDLEYYRSSEVYRVTEAQYNKFFVMHTRTATTGDVDSENTHNYQIGDWFFAHNGMISGMAGGGYYYNNGYYKIKPKKREKTDSLRFFEKISQLGINTDTIRKVIAQSGFWGIGVLTNRKTGQVWLFNKSKPINVYTDEKKSALVFSSFPLVRYNYRKKNIQLFGVDFLKTGTPLLKLEQSLTDRIVKYTLDGRLMSNEPISLYTPVVKNPQPVLYSEVGTGFKKEYKYNPDMYDEDYIEKYTEYDDFTLGDIN